MTAASVSTAWLEHAALIVRQHILDAGYQVQTCLETTRAMEHVLRAHGLRFEPQPVAAWACCPTWWADMSAGVPQDQCRGFAFAVGDPMPGEEPLPLVAAGVAWDGHLILRSQDGSVLIDASADQLGHPDRGMPVLGPFVAPVRNPEKWLAGERSFYPNSATGVVLAYRATTDQTWRDTPVWTGMPKRLRAVADEALRRTWAIKVPK